MEARRRMARLLASDAIQARISRLNADVGEFCADVIEAYAADERVSSLDAREVLYICELAARLGLHVSPECGDARLTAQKGRAALLLGVGALSGLCAKGRPPF